MARIRQNAFRLLAWMLLGVCLAACGQKGPLYLPDADNGQPQQDDVQAGESG